MAELELDRCDRVRGQLGAVIDQVDGVREDVNKLEGYLKATIYWARILILAFVTLSLVAVLIYNFFAPKEKDVPDHIIEALRSAFNLGVMIDNGGVAAHPVVFQSLTPIASSTPNTSWSS